MTPIRLLRGKKIKEVVEFEDKVVLCKKCLSECREGQNEIDSFHACENCGKDDFIGQLKTIYATKQQITRYITP